MFSIVTDTEYTSGKITIVIDEITNPKNGQTNGFVIKTIFDN